MIKSVTKHMILDFRIMENQAIFLHDEAGDMFAALAGERQVSTINQIPPLQPAGHAAGSCLEAALHHRVSISARPKNPEQ